MLHAQLCNVYRVYCPNYILNKWEAKLEHTNSMKKVSKRNRLLTSEYEVLTIFKLTAKYRKSKYRSCPLKQKFTSMVDMWGLPDSASIESITHNGRNSGGHKWPKTCWVVYLLLIMQHTTLYLMQDFGYLIKAWVDWSGYIVSLSTHTRKNLIKMQMHERICVIPVMNIS